MENETLKQLVLAKGKEVAPECGKTYETKRGTIIKDNDRQIGDKFTGWQIWDYRASSSVGVALCDETPVDSHAWVIAAELLDIDQPVPIFDSQLHELCVALGWQGGTYHQVLAEVKRLKSFADEKRTESHC